MVRKEIITAVVKASVDAAKVAVDDVEREIKSGVSETAQDPNEQTAQEMDRITKAAIRSGKRVIVSTAQKMWGSSAKASDIMEDIDI